ncbi:MAG: class I SAM-dependent methyltransferase [Bacteroidia bacterium]|nr:class I SAM-dependent methyltransferase [Bacteroidia bacterium]
MDAQYEAKYHTLEERHWWFRGRRDLLLRWLRRVPTTARILEIGCSGGPLLLALHERGYTHLGGIDISESGIALAQARGLSHVAVMDAAHPTLPHGAYDLLIASDVLEHIRGEGAALNAWYDLLAPGGQLWVFVPAYEFLWSAHDLANHHQRRYTRRSLRAALAQAGFTVERAGYWNAALFLPAALIRLPQRKVRHLPPGKPLPSDDLRPLPGPLNTALTTWLRLENALLPYLGYPFGVSAWAVAQKP